MLHTLGRRVTGRRASHIDFSAAILAERPDGLSIHALGGAVGERRPHLDLDHGTISLEVQQVPYTQSMTLDRPGLVVFLIEQSAAMASPWSLKPDDTKAEALARYVNEALDQITMYCWSGRTMRNRCHVALLGYHGNLVQSAWGGKLAGRDLVSISDVASSPLGCQSRREVIYQGDGGLEEIHHETRLWIEPLALGDGTPAKRGLAEVLRLTRLWALNRPDSFPPIIIHVSGNEPTDGDPRTEAAAIRALSTRDGHALLANFGLTTAPDAPILFLGDASHLPVESRLARLLFEISSEMPLPLLEEASSQGYAVRAGFRMVGLNTDVATILRLLPFAPGAAANPRG